MTRSTICVMSSTLALLALSAPGASAENIVTPKVITPKVSVHPVKPKVAQPAATINWGDGTAEGAASRNKDSTLNPQPLPPVHDPGPSDRTIR